MSLIERLKLGSELMYMYFNTNQNLH